MKKVLTIDDSMFMRKILISILSDRYEMLEANCSTDGIKVCKEQNPDLVLLDVCMSESEEGVKVLEKIKNLNPNTKVIMITAIDQDRVIKKCERLGAEGYINKPFNENQILKVVENCLE